MKKNPDAEPERPAQRVPHDETIDLNAGYGPLRLAERRDRYRTGRGGAWAVALESLARGISSLN